MKSLSSGAEKTILEMIRRYQINIGTKGANYDFASWEKEEVMFVSATIAALMVVLGAIYFTVNGNEIAIIVMAISIVASLFMVVHLLQEEMMSSFGKFLRFGSPRKIYTSFNRVRRYFKIKTSKRFESALKENYQEIKVWFDNYSTSWALNRLINEMQFPSGKTDDVNVEKIISNIKKSKINDTIHNSNFISVEDLNSMSAPKKSDEAEVKFFEKNG